MLIKKDTFLLDKHYVKMSVKMQFRTLIVQKIFIVNHGKHCESLFIEHESLFNLIITMQHLILIQ